MNIKQVSTSACETVFDVDGEQIRLWIITGGTPALSFEDFAPYRQRYPSLEKWSDTHWHNADTIHDCNAKSHYDHQDPKNVLFILVKKLNFPLDREMF